jgi:hypothetical protein
MSNVLAFDWGTAVVGILDVRTEVYTPYRGADRMTEGAKRIVSAEGTIVSFNGNGCDLPRLFELLHLDQAQRVPKAMHDDMMKITSDIRWPPDLNTASIKGPGLGETYAYYFGNVLPPAPDGVIDDYEVSNWRDCYMTAALWKRWKQGELRR